MLLLAAAADPCAYKMQCVWITCWATYSSLDMALWPRNDFACVVGLKD